VSTAMVIFQFEAFVANLIFHLCRQTNFPVWQQLSPS